MKYTRAWKQ